MIADIPTFFDMFYTETSGKLAPDGYLYNDQLNQTLDVMLYVINNVVLTSVALANNETININGLIVPSKTTVEITALEPDAPNGTLWFNTTIPAMQYKESAGVIKTITAT